MAVLLLVLDLFLFLYGAALWGLLGLQHLVIVNRLQELSHLIRLGLAAIVLHVYARVACPIHLPNSVAAIDMARWTEEIVGHLARVGKANACWTVPHPSENRFNIGCHFLNGANNGTTRQGVFNADLPPATDFRRRD